MYAVVPDGAGGWYIGGDFAYVGGLPRNCLAHIASNFTVAAWNPNANAVVRALAVSGYRPGKPGGQWKKQPAAFQSFEPYKASLRKRPHTLPPPRKKNVKAP